MKLRCAILLAAFPFSLLCGQEETVRFERIGLDEGLPQGQILGLTQDRQGYLWFGTMTGLVRYDGYQFVRYAHDPADSCSLSHATAKAPIEDRRGDIWCGGPYGLNRRDCNTGCFRRFFHEPGNPNSLPGNAVEALFEDSQGWIWIGTADGVAWFDGVAFHRVAVAGHAAAENGFQANSFAEDADGNILAGMVSGLARINRRSGAGVLYPLPCGGGCNPAPVVHKVYRGRDGRIWAGTNKGLFSWDGETGTFTKIPLPGAAVQQAVRSMIEDGAGRLWLSTLNDNGLFRLHLRTGAVEHFRHAPENSFSPGSDHLRDFLIDGLGQLWIGAYNGLNKTDLHPPRFAFLQQAPGDGRSENLIFRAHLDRWGGLWFSTYGQKTYYAGKAGQKALEMHSLPFSTYPVEVDHFISTSDGEVWIAPDPNGVIRYHVGSGRSRRLDGLHSARDSLEVLPIFYMEEDVRRPEYVWFSSRSGLCRFSRKTKEHRYFPPEKDLPELKDNLIVNGLQVGGERIYVLLESHFNGRLGYFDKTAGRYRLIETAGAFPDGKSTLHVRQFAAAPDGRVWMATSNGLGSFDPRAETFRLLDQQDGLTGDNLMGVAVDRRGRVWVKSMQHLYRYDPIPGEFLPFSPAKDMKEFNSVGASTGPGGHILFYGNNGFYLFHPDSVRLDSTPPQVALTDFRVLNRSRLFGGLPDHIRDITLGYRDNVFTFEYAALHLRDPKRNRYRYRLQGFDKNWVEAGAERRATYTNLGPGRYVFQVMASNADGVWNPEPLAVRLRILPPPWRTWWAYLLYGLLAAAAARAFYYYKKRQWQMKAELDMEHRETERLKELDTVKTRLYTNITHEFRTPLAIILGMAEQIKANPKDWYSEGLHMIERNGKNLLRLVNQMLDLAKLEAGALPIHLERGDLVAFLKYLLESFHSLVANKGIALHFHSNREEFVMDFDAEKLREIVTNLLSNAVKFTPEGGRVDLRLAIGDLRLTSSGDAIVIRNTSIIIRDTGIGIPPEKLPLIFDRFYQADDAATRHAEGAGIGLALTKELVKLLGGEISVKSELGKGTEFELRLPLQAPPHDPKGELPLQRAAETIENKALEPIASSSPLGLVGEATGKGEALLLLVEDNPDVVRYLQSILASHSLGGGRGEAYRIEVAANGRQGIEKAIEAVPDVIISDVMMPEADGYELCAILKKDERTSHIPIILLTAKADAASRLEGLECGADAYLAKPFDRDELLVRLRKLVELRKKLQERYRDASAFPAPSETKEIQLEDAFMKKVREILEAQLGDENYGIPGLCKTLGMSRAQLYRKFQALAGQPVMHYFRSLRLLKAKTLLQTTGLHISEIAYEVGFKDPAHFTRAFSEEFGVKPSEVRKQ